MTEHVLKILRYEHCKILKVCFMRATREGLGSRPPLPFFENRKKHPDFGKEGPDSVHLWVKYSIQNVVLRVSRRKNSKIFPAGPFFLVFLTKF